MLRSTQGQVIEFVADVKTATYCGAKWLVRALDSVYLSNPDTNIIVPNSPYSVAFLLYSFSHTLSSPVSVSLIFLEIVWLAASGCFAPSSTEVVLF